MYFSFNFIDYYMERLYNLGSSNHPDHFFEIFVEEQLCAFEVLYLFYINMINMLHVALLNPPK